MELKTRKLKSPKKIERAFFDLPLNPILINKIRSCLLLTIDSEIPNNQKKANNFRINFHETIISPIEIKYYSFSSSKKKHTNDLFKEMKTVNIVEINHINFQKISLSEKKIKDAGNSIDRSKKYSEIIISHSKKELVKKGLAFLHNLATNFRIVKSPLKIIDKNDSLNKKQRTTLNLALIPCGSTSNIVSENNSSLKSSHTSRMNWINEKNMLESPSTASPCSKRPISEEDKIMILTKNAINQEEIKQNLNEERSKLTFLNFHPNKINKNNVQSNIIGKPPLGKKLRRKTEQPSQNYINLGESKICNSPMN